MLCHLPEVEVINTLDELHVTRIETKARSTNEGVDSLYRDRVRLVEAIWRSTPQPHPRLPDVGQRQRERRAVQFGLKLRSYVLPVLSQGALKTAFQPVPPRPAFFVPIKLECALSVAG